MERILRSKELFMILIPEIREHAIQDDLDMKWLENIERNMILELTNKPTVNNNVTAFGERINTSVVEDEKENFLMPAPRGRPRNKKRSTKSTLDDGRTSRSKAVTRSSKITEVTEDEEEVVPIPIETKKTRRTKASTKRSLCPEITVSGDASMVSIDTESSMTAETSKSRRTTRKMKEKLPPRASKAMHASTRASYKCRPSLSGVRNSIGYKRMTKRKSSVSEESENIGGKRMTRNKAGNVSTYNSSILEVAGGTGSKRMTRSRAAKASMLVETDTLSVVSVTSVLKSPASNKNAQTQSPAVLFSPYAPNSVKKRVEAFEEFTSTVEQETKKGKKKGSSTSKQAFLNIISPIPKIIKPKVDSPMVKSKAKPVNKKASPLHEGSSEELADKAENDQEANNMALVLVEEEVEENKTYQANDMCDSAMEVDEKALNGTSEEKTDKEVENEADDEWVSDDDDKKPDSAKKTNRYFSSTPKTVASPKIIEAALGSYKALRNRKVQNTSIDALTLGSKSKVSNYVNVGITPVQQHKSMEFEIKEAELKKKMEKEVEAVKRKEEIMKKRTEAAKRKREEKMAKVKRTREERDKERKDAKTKMRKVKEDKKKPAPVAEPEVDSVKSPINTATPKEAFNATFDVGKKLKETDVDSYNMTPCWQDVPPDQPDNPNDYGLVDKSDCSSDEENDPRKKVPLWAQLKANDCKLITQAMLSQNFINGYWNCKPRAPTIKELFGLQVSKKTLKRGLNYRTSSACWNTPPSRKFAP